MFAIGVRSIAKLHFWMLDTEPVHQRPEPLLLLLPCYSSLAATADSMRRGGLAAWTLRWLSVVRVMVGVVIVGVVVVMIPVYPPDIPIPMKITIVVILAVVGYVDGGGCIEMVMVVVVDVLRLSK